MTADMTFDKEMAAEYDKGIRRTLPTYDSMFRLVQAYLRANTPQQANLLLLGAGGGNELSALGPSNPTWTFTAVDPASSMLDMAKWKAQELSMKDSVKFIEGTVEDVDNEVQFDAATCMLVLHFIPDIDDKRRLLKKVRQHLQPGAPFVLASMYGDRSAPAFDELVNLWKAYWLDSTKLTIAEVDAMEKTVRGLSFLPEGEIVQLLDDAGFDNIAKFFSTTLFGGWICKAR